MAVRAVLVELGTQLVQNRGQLVLFLVGQRGEQVGGGKLATLGNLTCPSAAVVGQIQLDGARIGFGLAALDEAVLLETREHLPRRLRANTQQEGQILLRDALLHRNHGKGARLTVALSLAMALAMAATGTVAMAAMAVTAVSMPVAMALGSVIHAPARAMTVRSMRTLGFLAHLGTRHPGFFGAFRTMAVPMPVPMFMATGPFPIDMAHDHARAHELLHELFIVDRHMNSFH